MSNHKGEEPKEEEEEEEEDEAHKNLDKGVEEINEDDGGSAQKEEEDEVRLVSPEEEEGEEEKEGVEADTQMKRKGKEKWVEPKNGKKMMISKFKKLCICGSNSSRKKKKTEKKKKKNLSSSSSTSSSSPPPFPLLYDPEDDSAAAPGCYRCFNSAKKPSTVYYGFVKSLLENNDFYSEDCNVHRYIPRPAAEKDYLGSESKLPYVLLLESTESNTNSSPIRTAALTLILNHFNPTGSRLSCSYV